MTYLKGTDAVKIFDKVILAWHGKEKNIKDLNQALIVLNNQKDQLVKLVHDMVIIDTYLWHLEDKARASSFSDKIIADIKRAIDVSNQRRNNKMEEIDEELKKRISTGKVKLRKNATINSETPGSILDRLSTSSLKIYHMGLETKRKDASKEHKTKCFSKLAVLKEQRKDLTTAFDELIKDLFSGRKRLKMYYQFKMYNDPSTNPWMKKK